MSFIDAQTRLSNAQAITASVASTNCLDLTDANHQIGQAVKKPKLTVVVRTAFTGSLTSMDVALQDCATEDGSYLDTSLKVSTILKAKLVAGAVLLRADIPETGGPGQIAGSIGTPPPGPSPIRRFVQVYYTLTGGAAATGAVDAWIDTD